MGGPVLQFGVSSNDKRYQNHPGQGKTKHKVWYTERLNLEAKLDLPKMGNCLRILISMPFQKQGIGFW